jgi:broad-specificity NMP kinase
MAQFDNPLEYRQRDHVTTFINMYRISRDNANMFEDEEIDNLNELRDGFYIFMQKLFKEYFNIGIVDFDDMSEVEQDDFIHFIYRFFIINIKRNFVNFILNKIENNKNLYNTDIDKKKDIITLSLKKDVSDTSDLNILSSLPSIINDIFNSDIDVDDFLDNCDNDSTLETRFIKKGYDDFKITGNFVSKYINIINDEFKTEIESKVRNKILKKYQNRLVNDNEGDDE